MALGLPGMEEQKVFGLFTRNDFLNPRKWQHISYEAEAALEKVRGGEPPGDPNWADKIADTEEKMARDKAFKISMGVVVTGAIIISLAVYSRMKANK